MPIRVHQQLRYVLLWLLCGPVGLSLFGQNWPHDSLRSWFNDALEQRALGEYEESVADFQELQSIAEKQYGKYDTFYARTGLELGLAYYLMGDFGAAVGEYEYALDRFRQARGTTREDTLNTLYRLGVAWRENGDLFRAEDNVLAALAVVEADSGSSGLDRGKFHNALGNITLRQESYVEAHRHYMAAEKYLIPVLGDNSPSIGAIRTNLGIAYLNLDSLENALQVQLSALAVFEKKLPPNHPTIAYTYQNIGEIFLVREEPALASLWFGRARDFWASNLSPDHVNQAIVRYQLAETRRLEGDGLAALGFIQEALAVLDTSGSVADWRTEIDPGSVRSTSEYLNTLQRKARILNLLRQQRPDQFRLDDVIATYDQIGRLADYMRRTVSHDASREFVGQMVQPAYAEAVDLAWSVGGREGAELAFTYAEKGRNAILQANVRGLEAWKVAGVPSELLERKTRLATEIQHISRKINEENGRGNLYGERVAKEEAYADLLDSLERNYPRYFELQYGHTTISLDALRDNLRREAPETAALIYFAGTEYVYGWQVNADSFSFHRLLPVASVDSLVRQALQQVAARKDPDMTSQVLYEALLAPLISEVDSKLKITRLRIVRDGTMEYLPFAMLRDEEGKYVIEKAAISYLNSPTLAFNNAPERRASTAYMGFGRTFKQRNRFELPRLPHAGEEIAAAHRLYGGSQYLEADASETRFVGEAPRARLLHLATHTLIDDRQPLYSRLVLLANEASDGSLYTYELFGMDLAADLVVLSACQTGYGRLRKGEGMMSLAQGFAYAGVGSVVMTHWPVNDVLHAKLMERFFAALAEGVPMDVALQAAQLQHLNEADEISGHPWFWAGPALVGNVKSLPAEKGSVWGWLVLLALVLGGMGVWRMQSNAAR